MNLKTRVYYGDSINVTNFCSITIFGKGFLKYVLFTKKCINWREEGEEGVLILLIMLIWIIK